MALKRKGKFTIFHRKPKKSGDFICHLEGEQKPRSKPGASNEKYPFKQGNTISRVIYFQQSEGARNNQTRKPTLRTINIFLMVFLLISLIIGLRPAYGQEEKKNKIEIGFSYDYLTPADDYPVWRSLSLGLSRKERQDLSAFITIEGFSRDRKSVLLTSGVYKDWSEFWYTYTDISMGSKVDYLPRFRFDQEVNRKFGVNKELVFTLGVSYLRYFDVYKDFIIFQGIRTYYQNWIFGYTLFRNQSDPGKSISLSHTLFLTYGQEGRGWTDLTLSFGEQAYLAVYLSSPQEVKQDSTNISLKHRHWLARDYGLFGEFNYSSLDQAYEKYRFLIGIFEFF